MRAMTYSDMNLVGRKPSRLFCGLGGLEPEKKGWANLAMAFAARFEYFCGGSGEREPERSDIMYKSPWHTTSDRIGGQEAESWRWTKGASGEGRSLRHHMCYHKVPSVPVLRYSGTVVLQIFSGVGTTSNSNSVHLEV